MPLFGRHFTKSDPVHGFALLKVIHSSNVARCESPCCITGKI
ncbi:hypothetical protein VCRA2119O147_1040020 [Vibrio crassostreae]|nr:hypothetical protein VCRA2119O44_140054 [Vibrio crassostreae]CAK1763969.1 hypothetical protein VCRA2119O47_140084 [Vibrio crassostreae]CAK1791651.1 hypothetical protein VCRA2116O28_160043 [Vibrio crassostreae]CAK1805408.1 hypothetical protein VCRA2116O27_170054 [Vibrio crassostreae]CAK1807284.1 hypothetical protein VCRA2117O38_170053 [Vibrio crassostreae]